jgi:hypothetical protein
MISTKGYTTEHNHIELSECILEFTVGEDEEFESIMHWENCIEGKYYCTFRTFYHNAFPSDENIRARLKKFYKNGIN